MAFRVSHKKFFFGKELIFPNAYCRVSNVSGDKNNVIVQLTIYDDAIAHILAVNNYNFKPSQSSDSERWDKQAYDYLKTLPEYIDAADC